MCDGGDYSDKAHEKKNLIDKIRKLKVRFFTPNNNK